MNEQGNFSISWNNSPFELNQNEANKGRAPCNNQVCRHTCLPPQCHILNLQSEHYIPAKIKLRNLVELDNASYLSIIRYVDLLCSCPI